MKQFIYKPMQSSYSNQAQAWDLDTGYTPSQSALKAKKEQYKKVLKWDTQIHSNGTILPWNNVPSKMGNIQAYIEKTWDKQWATNWALKWKTQGTKDYDDTLKAVEWLWLLKVWAFNSAEQSSQRERDRQTVTAWKKLNKERKDASIFQWAADVWRWFVKSFEKTWAWIREVFWSDETLYRNLLDKKYQAKKSTLAHWAWWFAGDVAQIVWTSAWVWAWLKWLWALKKLNTARKAFIAWTALDAWLWAWHSALQAKKWDKLKAAWIWLAFWAIPFATKSLQSVYKKVGWKVWWKIDKFLWAISDPLTINSKALISVKNSIYKTSLSWADKIKAVKELTETFKNAKAQSKLANKTQKTSKTGKVITPKLLQKTKLQPSLDKKWKIVGTNLSWKVLANNAKELWFIEATKNISEMKPWRVKFDEKVVKKYMSDIKQWKPVEKIVMIWNHAKWDHRLEAYKRLWYTDIPVLVKPSKSTPLIDNVIDNPNSPVKALKPKLWAINSTDLIKTPKQLYTIAKKQWFNEDNVKWAANELFWQESIKWLSWEQLSAISNKLWLITTKPVVKPVIKWNIKWTVYQNLSPASKVLSELPEAQWQYYKLREAWALSHKTLKAIDDTINDKLNPLNPLSVKKIYAYLLQNTPNWKEALKTSWYKTPDIAIKLNWPEKIAHDTIRKELDKTLIKLQQTWADIEWLKNYMPLINKRKFFFDSDVDVDFRSTLAPERKVWWFLKKRETWDVNIEPDLRQALNRYFQAANREIYVKPVAVQIRKWIWDVELWMSHPEASRYLDKLLDFTVEWANEWWLVSKILNTFKNRATSAALFLKPISAIMTAESAAAWIAQASPKSITKALSWLYRKPVWKDWKIISWNPSSESTELFQRMYDPDMNQWTTNFKSAFQDASYDINWKLKFSFNQLAAIDKAIWWVWYIALKELDYISYKATFNANYYDWIEKWLSHLEAVRKADDAAIATHSSYSRENRPLIQRGTFWKWMTSMLSPTIVSILEKVDMTKNLVNWKNWGHLKAIQTFALMSAWTYWVNEALNSRLDIHMPAFNPAQLWTAWFKLLNGDIKWFDKDMKDVEDSIPLIWWLVQEMRLQIEEGWNIYKWMLPALVNTLENDSTKQLWIWYRIWYKYIKDWISAIADLRWEAQWERRKYSDDQIVWKLLRMSSLLALPNNMVANLVTKPESLKERADWSVEYHTERLDNNKPSLSLDSSWSIDYLKAKQRAWISPYSTNEASDQRIDSRRKDINIDKFKQQQKDKVNKAFDSFLNWEVDIKDINQLNKQAPWVKGLILNYYNNQEIWATKNDQRFQRGTPKMLKILETIKIIKSLKWLPREEQLRVIKDGQKQWLFDPKDKWWVELIMKEMEQLNTNNQQ